MMVVLPGLQGLPDALAIAEKLRRLAREPVPIPEGEAHISISVGVALACAGESLDELMARADTAMYAAKQQGRDQVVAINSASRSQGGVLGHGRGDQRMQLHGDDVHPAPP